MPAPAIVVAGDDAGGRCPGRLPPFGYDVARADASSS